MTVANVLRGRFFYCRPDLLQQRVDAGSSLQLGSHRGGNSGYQQSLSRTRTWTAQALRLVARSHMQAEHRKNLGQFRRGTCPINASFLKMLRRRCAAAGGRRFAGNGVGVQEVARKILLSILLRSFMKTTLRTLFLKL